MLSKVVGFLMLPIYTHHLSTEDYGVLELLTLVGSIFSMILSFRLTAGMMRFYYQYKNSSDKKALVSTTLISVFLIAAMTAFFLCKNSAFVSHLVFGHDQHSRFFTFIFLSLVFDLGSMVSYTYLTILEKSFHFIMASTLQLILGLSLNVYLIVFKHLGVVGVLYSMVISNGIICSILICYTFSHVGFRFDIAKLREQVVFGLPLVPASLLTFVLNMGDRFLLNQLGELGQVGIYALGYKFGMLIGTFISGPFQQIWGPQRIKIYEEGGKDVQEIISRVLLYFTFVLSFVGLIISVLIKDAITIMAAREFLPAYRIVPLVVFGYIFYSIYPIVDIGFYVKKKTYWYAIINGAAASVNILLNWFLIPRFGAMGAAVVTVISFAICPLMAYFISQKYLAIRYDLVRMTKLIVVVLLCYAVISQVAVPYLYLDILLKLTMVLLFPIALYCVGFFEAREIHYVKTLLQNRYQWAK